MVVRPAKLGIERIGAYMADEVGYDLPAPRILLNSNESAFGASPKAMDAAQQAAAHMERYFEGADGALAPRIASFFNLDESRIVVGGGSDDLLSRIARIYLGPGDELLRSGEFEFRDEAHVRRFASRAKPATASPVISNGCIGFDRARLSA